MGLKIGSMVMGYVQTNCYFVYDEEKKDAIVFDPPGDGKGIYNSLKAHDINVGAIFLTHGHFDHIMGVNELRDASGAKVYASKYEEDVLLSPKLNVSYQFGGGYTVKADVLLADGDEVEACGIKVKMISTPGHTKGSCCYYFEDEGYLIAGDTLFSGSCGRTDLPTGSGAEISRSIKDKLMKLPDDVKLYPGHGETSTIGEERMYNPFC